MKSGDFSVIPSSCDIFMIGGGGVGEDTDGGESQIKIKEVKKIASIGGKSGHECHPKVAKDSQNQHTSWCEFCLTREQRVQLKY